MLFDSNGVVCTTFDGAVIGDNHAFNARDAANTGYDAAGGDVFARIEIMTSEWG